MNALVRLAWMHVLRIHPRAQALLKQASAMCQSHDVTDETRGMVEQTWGEYWRLAGDLPRAIEAKHRALAISQRRGDLRAVLVSYLNLVLCYGEAKDLLQAKAYSQKVLDVAATRTVEPALLASTHHNLAVAYVYSGRYDLAIDSFQAALELSRGGKLSVHANRARFNLANAYYHRFVETGDRHFEQLGDAQLEAFNMAPAVESIPAYIEEAKTLKAEVLGQRPERPIDHLLDGEAQEHIPQAYEVKRQRAVLADPASDDRARHAARLAIAKAYQAMALAEHAAAEQLAERLGLSGSAARETSVLGQALQGDLSAESRARAKWDREAADLLAAERRAAVLDHLLREGAINKSGYAERCGVSPATASKHLATLAERGLLTQTGKGPSTRYILPA